MSPLQIIQTADGSHSLYNPELDETYHSRHGAVQESMHVFIKHGLEKLLEEHRPSISVLEVGFGTGLNALLAWRWASDHRHTVSFTTVEPFPIEREIWSKLNYADELGLSKEFQNLHNAPWEIPQTLSEFFSITKLMTTLQALRSSSSFDLVFFDAFAPGKQNEMWHPSIFERVMRLMKPGAMLVTYCAKGQVKRDLKSVGFSVEALAGPPGKREMIRATSPIT